MDQLETAMGLIAGAGDSRSSCMEAIAEAKEGDFEKARALLDEASATMVETHEVQTDLIRAEMAGNSEAVSLLMVHAQDHLTMAMLMRDIAEEFVNVYERLEALEGKQ
jgi:PTS system cellobiose-specific IIA component